MSKSRARTSSNQTLALLRKRGPYLAGGAACGLFIWTLLQMLGLLIPPLDWPSWHPLGPLVTAIAGGLVGVTRLRWPMWILTGALSVVFLVVVSTPITQYGLQAVVRGEAPVHADAVVVLTGGIRENGEPGSDTEQRLLHAYELIHEGYAPRLVVTRLQPPAPSHAGMVRAHLRRLGLDWPVDEAPRPVRNTHDEALSVSEMVREQGWKRVLLVTQPTHCRRAAAVFRKAGVDVVAVPCLEPRYSLQNPFSPNERLTAFSDIMRELVGMQAYRLRGWI